MMELTETQRRHVEQARETLHDALSNDDWARDTGTMARMISGLRYELASMLDIIDGRTYGERGSEVAKVSDRAHERFKTNVASQISVPADVLEASPVDPVAVERYRVETELYRQAK